MPNVANIIARHAGMDMDMGGMNATATGTAHGAMSTAAKSGGGGMSMGGSCKISMLWNWTTVDSCFLSKTWHNTTKGMFAGSVIGVFFLCMAIELVRRFAREYDRRITAAGVAEKGAHFQPTLGQHVVRSLMYGAQFTAGFLVMLLGMYYNGYILFAIFLGHTIGYFAFARDTCTIGSEPGKTESGCAC